MSWPLVTRQFSAELRAALPTFLPPPNLWPSITGLTPAGLFLADDKSISMRDAVGNQNLVAVGTPTFDRWVKGYRGVYPDAGSEGFALNAFAPAAADYMVVGAISVAGHVAANRGILGYHDSGDNTSCYAFIDANDKVNVYVADPSEAHYALAAFTTAVVFGDVYVIGWHVCRTSGFRYARLVNLTTGAVQTLGAVSIATFNAITGGSAPLFNVGYMPGAMDGTGITHLGHAILTAGIGTATALADIFADLGVE